MVESQMRDFCDWEPPGCCSVVLALDFCRGVDDEEIGCSDGAVARITIDARISADLVTLLKTQACLFLELSDCALLESFVHIEEAAGESPATFEGGVTTLNEQDLREWLISHYYAVGCDCWAGVFVDVHSNSNYFRSDNCKTFTPKYNPKALSA